MSYDSLILLAQATVQDIQLELIRRRRFNEFDGGKVVESLLRHRQLWISAAMDRIGVFQREHPDWIPAMSLIKLRDLHHNQWNVDILFLLTKGTEEARRLADIAKEDDWVADEVIVQDNEQELSMALGIGPCPYRMLTAWWD